MQAKHSVEKQAAHFADCFTTVSDITARECTQLLCKTPDVVTPNGFEDDFIPKAKQFGAKRAEARQRLKEVAECLLTYELPEDAVFVATGGRYEFLNKGLDVFIESLKSLEVSQSLSRTVVAFLMVPAYISGPREDLQKHLSGDTDTPHVSHRNVVWINKELGSPNLEGRNAKYLVPFWCTNENRGAKRIYHILDIKDNEITLGNSFVIEQEWNKMGQFRKFEYHSLESFNFIEVKDGFLIPYDFQK